MSTSAYSAFDVLTEDISGARTPLPLQAVDVYDVTHGAALSSLAADGNGHVAAGSLPVVSGTIIVFSADLGNGRKGYAEIVTS
jgi:hypothetical protein